MSSKVNPQQSSVGEVSEDREYGEHLSTNRKHSHEQAWYMLTLVELAVHIRQAVLCSVQFWATVTFFFSLLSVTQVFTVTVDSSPPTDKL